ncbi:MAG: hypothetical protein JST68_04455 [Bacteroidetes bacterium]|nr:hypothetical protein [Bacteroidota bacterium]
MIVLILSVIVPLVVSNVLHMVVVKRGMFPSLAVPVSRRLFGANKTWRGFVVVPVLNGILMLVAFGSMSGFLLGLAYVLFELPNSWLKRRVGIEPGGRAGRYRVLFVLLDKSDSSFGVSLVSWWLFGLDVVQAVDLFVISVAVHVFFSWLLVMGRIKRSF